MNISGNDNKRIEYTVRVLLCIAVVLVGRLFFLQIIDKSDLQAKNLSQVQVDRKLQSPRGTIYDRNGRPLAMSVVTKSLYADPKMIKQSPSEVAELIVPYVTMSKEDIVKSLQEDTAFVWIDRMMEPEKSKAVAQLIEDKNLEGLNFVEESKRYYPNGNLAAQVLGFVGTDDKGLDGLEMVLDDELKGGIQKELVATDRKGNAIFGSVLSKYLPDKGKSVTLTIDASIQFIAERALDKAMEDTGAKHASVIVMDPKTGEILAMANRPTYDPNHYSQGSEEDFKNIAVTNLYEPGSTFKLITSSSALEEGVIKDGEKFTCTGSVTVGGRKIKCWRHYRPHGTQEFKQAVQNSCNPVFVELGSRLGVGKMYDYIESFGLMDKTGIDLPGEAKGILYNEKNVGPVELATISFGQSISVTPIQLITAISSIANGGDLMQPRVVKSYTDNKGNITETVKPKKVRSVISKETSKKMLEIAESVVTEGGGKIAYIPGYRLGGKTGTAQKVIDGKYAPGKYICSFVGIAPCDDPQIVVLAIVDEPTGVSAFGSTTAGPIVKEIMNDSLKYLGVKPVYKEEEKAEYEKKQVKVPDVRNLKIGDAVKALEDAKLKPDLDADIELPEDTKVKDIFPKPGVKVNEDSSITLYFEN